MTRWPFVLSGLFGCSAIVLGAYGAHGLSHDVALWQNAVQYQVWHALLIAVFGTGRSRGSKLGVIFATLGILLFCGSLYAKILTGMPGIGRAAPYGGVSFMLAWLCLLLKR